MKLGVFCPLLGPVADAAYVRSFGETAEQLGFDSLWALMLLLARMGLVKAATLARNRKYVLLGCFVIGAVISPPDVFSQTMVSLPMFLLFEASVWVIRLQDLLRRGKAPPASPAG